MTESGGRRQLSSRQSCFTDNSQSVSWVAQSPQGDTNTNKLGQRQSQTPFSSAFSVQKDLRSKEVLGPKKF